MNSGKSNFEPESHSLYSRKDSINDNKLLGIELLIINGK